MGLTFDRVLGAENLAGRLRTDMFDITFDSSYASGGEALAAANVGLKHLLGVQFLGGNAAALGYVPYFDSANNKVVMLRSGALTPTDSKLLYSYTAAEVLGADADVANSDTVDQASGMTNDDVIDTYAVAAAWTYTENLEIDHPRNVSISLQGAAANNQFKDGDTVFTITGFFRGAAQTDVITFSLTGGNRVVANGKFRWLYGVKPFDRITGVVAAGLEGNADDAKIGVGVGRLFGMPVNTNAGVEGDIEKVVVEGVDVAAATYVYNDTNKTLDLGAFTAADSFLVQYFIDNSIPNAAAAAVLAEPTGVDLSSLTIRVQVTGW